MSNGTAAKAASKPDGEGMYLKIKKFIRECKTETFVKASWPTKDELKQFTAVVLFALVIVCAWITGIDSILKIIFNFIGGAR